MSENSIEQRVVDIIVEQLGVNADQVTPELGGKLSTAEVGDAVLQKL